MRIEDLVGRQARILPTFELDIEMPSIIRKVDEASSTILLGIEPAIQIERHLYEYAVAMPRLMHQSLSDLAQTGSLASCVTLIPSDRFDTAKPFDVSWWRGGPAATTDIVLIPSGAAQ